MCWVKGGEQMESFKSFGMDMARFTMATALALVGLGVLFFFGQFVVGRLRCLSLFGGFPLGHHDFVF